VFEFDADLSHDPRYLPGFVAVLAGDADMVVGSRRITGGGVQDWGWLRRFVSWGGSHYSRLVLGVPIRDLTGGFNGFRRETLQGLGLAEVKSSGYCFQIELKYRAMRRGYRIVEGPIVFPDRRHGTSKMSGAIVLEAIVQVWKLRFRGAALGPGGPWRYRQLPPG
jgi:dolichol-phosphate mannosyltransferase